jgi:ribosomal protein S6--L-glutamate ligase
MWAMIAARRDPGSRASAKHLLTAGETWEFAAVLAITLISHSDGYYSTRRLLEAGQRLGYDMRRVDPVRVVLGMVAGANPEGAVTPAIFEDGVEVPVPDVVVPRIGAKLGDWSLAMLETWILRGARCPIAPAAIARASDKVLTTLKLVEAGLPVVPTVAVREPFHVDSALALLPGSSWVIKARVGTGGDGVALVHGAMSARSVLGALTASHETILVQPHVETRPTRDLRVLVAGGEPLCAYWREAHDEDFRANVHRGGRTREADNLTAGALELALAASFATGLPFAGIDLIETRSGLAVLEVNASPGFQGAEEASGRDLATPFLQRWVAWHPHGGGSP